MSNILHVLLLALYILVLLLYILFLYKGTEYKTPELYLFTPNYIYYAFSYCKHYVCSTTTFRCYYTY